MVGCTACLHLARRDDTGISVTSRQAADDSWASTKDLHNLYRIRTLTDKALQERIYTIRRIGKTESFIKVSLLCVGLAPCPHADLRTLSQERGGWQRNSPLVLLGDSFGQQGAP